MDNLNRIAAGLQEGDDALVAELTRQALAAGVPARQVLDEGLLAGMNVVGRLFSEHEIFLPDVLLAARAMYAGLDVLKPLLEGESLAPAGKVVIGTIQGDLHDIGKNLVGIMLRGAGFEVIDLGNDVPPEKFVATATREQAQVIGMSALLTTTMTGMQRVIELLASSGERGRIKTIIGGAPVTAEYARQIGADAYGFDAASAVERVKELTAR
ncbi:cobalamin-binding protein [candidate division WOR-3 bacterium]|nr:cobalamin-binding protein [candidate division WOR-3 bacterium]